MYIYLYGLFNWVISHSAVAVCPASNSRTINEEKKWEQGVEDCGSGLTLRRNYAMCTEQLNIMFPAQIYLLLATTIINTPINVMSHA
jgi:hypothetical protein